MDRAFVGLGSYVLAAEYSHYKITQWTCTNMTMMTGTHSSVHEREETAPRKNSNFHRRHNSNFKIGLLRQKTRTETTKTHSYNKDTHQQQKTQEIGMSLCVVNKGCALKTILGLGCRGDRGTMDTYFSFWICFKYFCSTLTYYRPIGNTGLN